MGIAHRGLDGGRIAQIGLHGVDLADLAERLQVPGQFRPPHRDPDPVIALGQRPDHVPPQKARSAENRDEGVLIRCHVVVPAGPKSGGFAGLPSAFAPRHHAPRCSIFGLRFASLTSVRPINTNRPGPRWRNW